MKRVWILGAPDPEMSAIEALLAECSETVAYATVTDRRVHPGNAYQADGPTPPPGVEVILVECDGPALAASTRRVDHHRPGDPGFGRQPAEFMRASSLGQVIAELARLGALPSTWRRHAWSGGVSYDAATYAMSAYASGGPATSSWLVGDRIEIPTDLILAAAADHCLGAAYRGECPGVDPDALMRWRAESRAAFQRRPVEAVLADVEAAQDALRAAPELVLMGMGDMPHTYDHDWSRSVCDGCARDPITVADMRRPEPVPELPEAAARLGFGYISGPLVGPDGRRKYTCSGTPEQVAAWMELWAQRAGLVDVYGDPARGFAGGYDYRD